VTTSVATASDIDDIRPVDTAAVATSGMMMSGATMHL
jgi:hypothetical protein